MRTTGTKMAQTVTQILADLENAGFDGTLEVTFRSGEIRSINHAPRGFEQLDPEFISCRNCQRQLEANTQESGWWEHEGNEWTCPVCLA